METGSKSKTENPEIQTNEENDNPENFECQICEDLEIQTRRNQIQRISKDKDECGCGEKHVEKPKEKDRSLKTEENQRTERDTEDFQVVKSKKAKKKERKEVKAEKVKMLLTINPQSMNSVEEHGEWEEIDMAVDSGATETVVGSDMLTSIETYQGEAAKRGVEYEVASGSTIPNLGEKKFVAVGEEGHMRRMRAQVCDVNKPLLSVHRMVQAGNRVVFDPVGSFVEDTVTGERMNLTEQGGMYMLKLWVKNPFHRQAVDP